MRNDHVSPVQMLAYLKDRLPEADREQVERELTACDECLQLFIGMMESAENEPLSSQPDFAQMERRVVAQLISEQEPLEQEGKAEKAGQASRKNSARLRLWLQHPATHYTIAASITLLLLASGTFASFSQKLAQLDLSEHEQVAVPPPAVGRPSISWSDKIVDQTGSWLDGLKASRFK
ncbi:hypothetical protein [Paenibacillus paridis]|uniref:hypothetical protein n=1 Tax=Paenibacillus paridis TaxID=2583376 RepID=UPI0011220FE8|nr:hypothetical protein [Paenibacillus paridis]